MPEDPDRDDEEQRRHDKAAREVDQVPPDSPARAVVDEESEDLPEPSEPA